MNKSDKIKALYAAKRRLKTPSKGKGKLTPSHNGKARLNGEYLRLTFKRDKNTISFVKKFDRKQYIKGEEIQVWEIPLSFDNINKLEQNGFELSDKINAWKEKLFAPVKLNPNFIVPNLKQKLLPYQNEGVQIIEAKEGKVLLADDQGLGKTAQAIAWTSLHPTKKPVLIICPAMLKGNWKIELDFWLKKPKVQIITGTKQTPVYGDYVIINYDILTKKENDENIIRQELWNTLWQVLILDEAHYCFLSNTKIETKTGETPIQNIKIGDIVRNAIGYGKVTDIQKNKVKTTQIISLHLSNNKKINCTSDHLFFTNLGWVKAKNLANNKLFTKKNISNIMNPHYMSKKCKRGSYVIKIQRNKKMQNMRKKIRSLYITTTKENLFNVLLSEVGANSGMSKQTFKRFEKCARKKSRMGKTFIKTYERKQSSKKSRDTNKNTTIYKKWKRLQIESISRWQRKTLTTSTKDSFGRAFRRMDCGISDIYKNAKRFGLSNLLQSGYWKPTIKNLDRIRWKKSQTTRTKNHGQEKRRFSKRYGLEGVTVQKQTSYRTTTNSLETYQMVYNLTVSGHPSYFAEGVLVHNCTNRQSIRGWAIEQLVKRIPHVIPITATPGKNRPKEMFTLINYVNPYLFPSFYRYAHRYCGPKKGYMGKWTFDGSSNETELHQTLSSTIMIRRKKTEIFKELDKKIRQVIPIEISNRKEYDKADEEFTSWVLENRPNSAQKAFKAAALYKFMLLEQIAVQGKIKACIEYLENLLETEEKIVAFAEHKVVIEEIAKHFKNIAVVVDGSTPPKKREEAKQLFQQCSRCKVRKEKHNFDKTACDEFQFDMQKRLFLSSSAGKEGNTLTAAYHVVFIELWWSPVDHDQAEDRVYGRAGDLHGGVMHYLIAKDTVEEHKAKIFDLKNEMLTKVLDGKSVSQEHILRELLKRKVKGD